MRLAVCAVGLSAALALAACSQGPVPVSRPFLFGSGQSVLAGLEHWQVLAEDTAANVIACLDGDARESGCRQDAQKNRTRPVYVERAESALPFARAYHDFLTAEFLRKGREVSSTPEGAVVVHYRIQHIGRGGPVPVDSFPGTYTLLAGAAAAAGQWGWAGLAGAGPLADAYAAANSQGRSQVVVTTSLTQDNRLIMQTSAGYFIPAADDVQFVSAGPVVGIVDAPRWKTPPAEVRAFPVVGR